MKGSTSPSLLHQAMPKVITLLHQATPKVNIKLTRKSHISGSGG
jgi:hypothetical protein